jgi:polar amino acid transport system substrate-binding protein
MRRARWRAILVLAAVFSLVAAACAREEEPAPPAAGEEATGLLAQVLDTGVIRVSTDPAYPPQSYLNPDTNEWEGFDIDVAEEIASRLGVEVEWITPNWNAIVSGGWTDRWDMSVGSMTITPERQEVLYFTEPYYYTPAVVVVHQDNTSVADVSADLDGATIGVCGACTYDFYLQKTLEMPGETVDFVIDDAEIKTYDTDTTALRELALGDGVRLDAVITSATVAQGAIDKGEPFKVVGDPVFYEPLSVAFDKSASEDATTLMERVDEIVGEMHADGTLSELSKQWFDGLDLTAKAS